MNEIFCTEPLAKKFHGEKPIRFRLLRRNTIFDITSKYFGRKKNLKTGKCYVQTYIKIIRYIHVIRLKVRVFLKVMRHI